MKTRFPHQLNLTLLSDVIEEFVDNVGASLKGRALVSIFGNGDEDDNWEALHYFLSEQDGRRVGTREQLLALLHRRVETQRHWMTSKTAAVLPNAEVRVFSHLSRSECEALALAVVFLAEQEVIREKGRFIGRRNGLVMLEHLCRWNRRAVNEYCLSTLLRSDTRFHKGPSELLPVVANRFYWKTFIPWLERGIASQ